MGKAIITGSVTAVIAAFLFAAILAKLVDMETLKMENIGYGILIAHLCAVYLGARVAMTGAGKEGTTAAGITGALYFLVLLLVNGLFFGGEFAGLGTTLLLVAAGVGLVLLTGHGRKPGRHRKRYKIPK